MTASWQLKQVLELFDQPFMDLAFKAHQTHRKNFKPNQVQLSTLLSIKTGACPEDCSYCSQSSRYDTGLEREKLMDVKAVKEAAQKAKEKGANRFCMGAAWRNPTDKNLDKVVEMIKEVKSLGLETCATLGMLTPKQAQTLKKAGLDYYNHNIDTSPDYYKKVISTRSFSDRIETLEAVRQSDIKVCCGGILGMGESRQDRAQFLIELACMNPQPESVPINHLVAIEGTPLEKAPQLDTFEFIKTIAIARLMMPKSYIRLSAGREKMSESVQAWCFFAGANSIFYGDELLTTANRIEQTDTQLLQKLGIEPEKSYDNVQNLEHNSSAL